MRLEEFPQEGVVVCECVCAGERGERVCVSLREGLPQEGVVACVCVYHTCGEVGLERERGRERCGVLSQKGVCGEIERCEREIVLERDV